MVELLINILFLITLVFILQIIPEWKKDFNSVQYKMYIFILGTISIIFCMTFTIPLSNDYQFDLRAIPLIIGGFYGGPIVTGGLYLVLVLYRFLIGGADLGFYGAIINNGLLAIIICFISRYFLRATLKRKVLLSISVVIVHVLISRLLYISIFQAPLPLDIFMIGSLMKLGGVLAILLLAQWLYRIHQLNKRVSDFEKMEIVSHLSASISHEVRNGLTGAKGFLQLLLEMENDEQKKNYMQIALSELNRTEEIIRDFLTFAKPAPDIVQQIDIKNVIENTIKVITPLANMHSVDIKYFLSSGKIIGDERLLQQSLLNIFKNAIESMPEGGLLEVHACSNDEKVVIIIKDTGIGMTEEQIERLGKPYYTTKGQKGTGLGMMVTYRVIEGLNGSIKVHSVKEKGTTFTIYLPLAKDVK